MMKIKLLLVSVVAAVFSANSAFAKPTLSADEFVSENGQGFWQVKVNCDNDVELTMRQSVEGDRQWCWEGKCNADKTALANQVCKDQSAITAAKKAQEQKRAAEAEKAEKAKKAEQAKKDAEARKVAEAKKAEQAKKRAEQQAQAAAERQRRARIKSAEIAAKKREIERQKAVIAELQSTLSAKEKSLSE